MVDNVRSPVARLSYPALFVPRPPRKPGQNPKYGATLIFDAESDLSALKKAAYEAAIEEWGEAGGKDYTKGILKRPFLDGGDPKWADREEFGPGKTFIRAFSERRPGVVNRKVEPILPQDADELVYPGCYVMATVRPYCYAVDGNRGVTFGLQNVQWVRHGPRLAGGPTAEQEFQPLPDEDVNGMEQAVAAGANAWE